jgi:hypothetical protein
MTTVPAHQGSGEKVPEEGFARPPLFCQLVSCVSPSNAVGLSERILRYKMGSHRAPVIQEKDLRSSKERVLGSFRLPSAGQLRPPPAMIHSKRYRKRSRTSASGRSGGLVAFTWLPWQRDGYIYLLRVFYSGIRCCFQI